MDAEKFDDVMAKHAAWLKDCRTGEQADFHKENLCSFDFCGLEVSRADFSRADLRGADFTNATATRADFFGADLRGAIFHGANLLGCDFRLAEMEGADLRGADIDQSAWPMFCGSNGVIVDARIAAQIAAHFCALDCDDPDYQAARAALLPFARMSEHAKDLGLLEE